MIFFFYLFSPFSLHKYKDSNTSLFSAIFRRGTKVEWDALGIYGLFSLWRWVVLGLVGCLQAHRTRCGVMLNLTVLLVCFLGGGKDSKAVNMPLSRTLLRYLCIPNKSCLFSYLMAQ